MTISTSRKAISLLPFGYLLVTRVRTVRDLGFLVATSWIPVWWLLVRLAHLGWLDSALSFWAGYIAFLSVYEIGYLVNDAWDARKSASGRARLPFATGPAYFAVFLIVRLSTWTAIAWATGFWREPIWLAGYLLMLIAFAMHNLVGSPGLRIASFAQLAVSRFALPILGQLPDQAAVIGFVAIIFYAYLRSLSYLDSKDLLNLPGRRAARFPFVQMLMLAPAAAFGAWVLGQPVILELLLFHILLYGAAWVIEIRRAEGSRAAG